MSHSNISADRLIRYAKQIQQWHSTCQQNHVVRCNQSGSSVLPKRLIFFDKNPNIYRLVQVDSTRNDYNYVALSYCWGRKENFKTTPSNLNEMEREIPHEQLPQTLKDVFALVGQLQYQYLWIDALCIVQDDHGMEWKTEAAKMGDVYANADLVIGAMASESVHDGLFVETNDFSQEEKTEFHRIMRTCRTMTQRDWHGGIKEKYPLLCRGWAFQERLLARRIVHFTVLELIWECMEDRCCECGDEGKERLSGKINNMNSALKECRWEPTPAKIRIMWHECVMSFSKRDLTMLDDRLFAIAGIASYIRGPDPTAHDSYFQGMWKDFLLWDLIWYCDQTSSLEMEKSRRPSYSWSSIDCGVEWPACPRTCELKDRFSLAISTGTCFESHLQGDTMTEAECFCATTTITSNHPNSGPLGISSTELVPAGCATEADQQASAQNPYTLTIVSSLTPVIIERQSEYLQTSWLVKNLKYGNGGALPFWPDIQLENSEVEDRNYYYVEMASLRDDLGVRQVGLIVRQMPSVDSGEQLELYERVGLAGNMSCDFEKEVRPFFLSQETHTVVLI